MSGVVRIVSPIDGEVYAERAVASDAAVARAVAAARSAQRAWARTPLADRAACVLRAVEVLRAQNADAVKELACMMGRPVRYGGEIGGVEERARHMAAIAEEALGPTVIESSAGASRRIAREPLGVVLVIAPWNYPYLTAINTIAPALIAGNAVLLKHASQTLLAGERFAAAFERAGLPRGLFAHLVMDHAAVERLIGEGGVDFVNFTGSVEGGRVIARAAAGSFTPVGLELGGKDSAYVRADADLDQAAAGLIDGAMYNAGQCCCGIERIYVAEAVFDEFCERSKAFAEALVLGNPRWEKTTLGPMAQKRLADTVRAHVDEALARGARGLVDVRRFPAADVASAYVAPQVLVEVDHDMRLMREETFGPVVGVMKVSGDAEAIQRMNDSAFGLTAAIYTQDEAAAAALGAQVDAGTIFMNRCDYLDPALPWSGRKASGRGVSLSALAYQSLTRPKAYHLRKA